MIILIIYNQLKTFVNSLSQLNYIVQILLFIGVYYSIHGYKIDTWKEHPMIFLFFKSFFLSWWHFLNHNAHCYTCSTIRKPSMNKGTLRWFHNVQTYKAWPIEYWKNKIENSLKSKLYILKKVGAPLVLFIEMIKVL